MFSILAHQHYVQFVLESVSANGFPKYRRMYTFNHDLLTTFATREAAQAMIDEYDPDPEACLPWRIYEFSELEKKVYFKNRK